MKAVKIAPSILAADFCRLETHVVEALAAGAEIIHVDVMDGCFVPQISFGTLVARAIQPLLARHGAVMDVHLMTANPERHLRAFAEAGADIITVHVETCTDLPQTIKRIRSLGAKPGVTLNPATPLSTIEPVLPDVDLALIMSVVPGVGGQTFLAESYVKIRQLRALLDECNPDADLEVDGGVKPDNAAEIVAAGANILVAGSAVFAGSQSVAANPHSFGSHFLSN